MASIDGLEFFHQFSTLYIVFMFVMFFGKDIERILSLSIEFSNRRSMASEKTDGVLRVCNKLT